MSKASDRAASALLLFCTFALVAMFSACGGGGAALPQSPDPQSIAPENENQGSPEQPQPQDEEPQQSPEDEGAGDAQQFGGGVAVGVNEDDATIIPNGRIPLQVGENLIDHWNYAASNGHIIEKNENFAGRELYMQVGTVEYQFTGLQEHWAIEAVEVKGFGHVVAGMWSSEFGYYWEGPTMYLDEQPTTTTFFFYDHIEDGEARLMLRTWAYADDIDASIYEVRVFVKNNAVLQATDGDTPVIGPVD